jgi:hypothetical protein
VSDIMQFWMRTSVALLVFFGNWPRRHPTGDARFHDARTDQLELDVNSVVRSGVCA